jgi:hypothetical protein
VPLSVSVATETEADRGWWFVVEVRPDAGAGDTPRTLRVRLDWADYEHWTRGKTPPSVAAAEAVRAVISLGALERVPDTFDAASLRRRIPGLDERVRARLATDLRGLEGD